MEDDDSIPISALQHYIYCPRQWALIHLECIWTENVQTAQGRLMHQRADIPATGSRHGVRTITSMALRHEELGIAGVADVVEIHTDEDGQPVPMPIEYKRGRPKAHRADEVQLCAQAMCLERMMKTSVPRGSIFYGQMRRRSWVEFDATLRELTCQVIEDVKALMGAGRTPSATYEQKRCNTCSLIDDCRPSLLSKQRSVADWLSSQLNKTLT